MKASGRKLHLIAEPDPDPRYPKPKGSCKQIANQRLRRVLKKDLTKRVVQADES